MNLDLSLARLRRDGLGDHDSQDPILELSRRLIGQRTGGQGNGTLEDTDAPFEHDRSGTAFLPLLLTFSADRYRAGLDSDVDVVAGEARKFCDDRARARSSWGTA